MRGIIVAFEGIDGSGLSTHSSLLADWLSSLGYNVIYGKEPTTGPIGEIIRRLMLEPEVDQEVLALLFAADRLWHARRAHGVSFERAVAEGRVVVLDRYKYSSIAYQGLEAPMDWVERINSFAPDPHVIIYIDVPPEVSLKRIERRSVRYYFETLERLRRLKESFRRALSLAREKGIIVLEVAGVGEGERPLDEVQREIRERLAPLLPPPSRRPSL